MRVKPEVVTKYVGQFAAEFIQVSHKGHKLEKKWLQTYLKNYEELRVQYKDCFGERRVSAVLDEHKVLACFLIALQMTKYPVDTETNKFRNESLAVYIFERTMEMFCRELHSKTKIPTYEKAYKNKFKYPEKINGNDDYRQQFVKSLHYSYANGNRDIFNLSNVMFLLEQFNLEYWKKAHIIEE